MERAQERLVQIGERRRRMSQTELKISAKARSSVRRAMQVGLSAREFSDITGYTTKTVDRWFESALHALEQAARQREVAQARRGKRRRPPQHLSPAQRAEWLAQRERRRSAVMQKNGFRVKPVRSPGAGRGGGGGGGGVGDMARLPRTPWKETSKPGRKHKGR
ncbi:hypothetical protein GCM10010253_67710 [Streptomyces badius]|uniref:Uncharacterized protein n=1 Tax=Streptomyces badius TaxID=1941 RepID=A0ABQ2TQ22_STRBA|nr:hypothetical protein GCM10010253_67710 [Streptomyces badius]